MISDNVSMDSTVSSVDFNNQELKGLISNLQEQIIQKTTDVLNKDEKSHHHQDHSSPLKLYIKDI